MVCDVTHTKTSGDTLVATQICIKHLLGKGSEKWTNEGLFPSYGSSMDSFVNSHPEKIKKRASVSNICPPPLLPLTAADIQPGTENDRIGLVRNTMFQNHLILKPELGRTRRRCTKIPGSDFVYGLTQRGTDGGVPEAIGHWEVMPHSVVKEKEKPKNFITMNGKAVKAGLVTLQDQQLYRRFHEVRCKEPDVNRFQKDPPRLVDAMTYGRPYRAPTPIMDVLQHKFGDLWIQEQQKSSIVLKDKKHQQKKRKRLLYETRTVLLRRHQIPMKMAPLWHLPNFEKTVAHLDTFPTQRERKNAFKAQQNEVSVRSGQFGKGIYTHTS